MDLYVTGLAPETTSNGLKKFLRPRLERFGITTFECKKVKGKGYGFITVPYVDAGESFLAAHRLHGSLKFVNALTVSRGNKPSDPLLVEGLRNRQVDKLSHDAQHAHQDTTSRKFNASYTYGSVSWYHERLSFHPEADAHSVGIVMFGEKALTLSSPPHDARSMVQTTKIEIAYSSVGQVFLESLRNDTQLLTLLLSYPPKVVQLPWADSIINMMHGLSLHQGASPKLQPIRVRGWNAQHELAVSTCLTYSIKFEAGARQQLKSFLNNTRGIPTVIDFRLQICSLPYKLSDGVESLVANLAGVHILSFAIKFQLQRLAQNCFLRPDVVQALISPVVALNGRVGSARTAQAIRNLARALPYADLDSKPSDFGISSLTELLDDCVCNAGRTGTQYTLAKKHRHLFLVHQALVTPAGVYLEGPELEPANRVLRRYSNHVETNFLRVRFIDEDGGEIRYDRVNSLERIHHRWFKETVLEGGVHIAGQVFTFLGFSNSSLKDQACWFMSSFWFNGVHLRSWGVIEGLGDFSHIKSSARCAARIGQAFTDTAGGALDIKGAEVRQISDVKRNGWVFSDGCGTISLKLLEKLWKVYRRNCRPTCFQIRYAGMKGMISLDSRLEGEVLCIRPSMDKFPAPDQNIEICDAARRPIPFFLNRPIIKILEDLHIKEDDLQELQARAVLSLKQNAASPIKAAAFLERFNVGKSFNLSWYIERLDGIGISCFDDAFLKSAVDHTVIMQLRLIKYKARIPVENAYTLFGIMDETATLAEGQILCRANGKTVTGPAAITRSPAIHPGDIQVARAVDVPKSSALMDLDNCVIFSQFGERDLPSQLGGGDLDGDLFNVIFDKRLIPRVVATPAKYERVDQKSLGRSIQARDITNWFIQFMENDQLGRISLNHLQVADYLAQGTLSPAAIQLARLHSTAVDFQKTGIPVDLSLIPRLKRERPDFMATDPRLLLSNGATSPAYLLQEDFIPSDNEEEDPDAAINPDVGRRPVKYYRSQKILGKLYRAIDERAFLDELEANRKTSSRNSITTRLFDWVKRETQGLQWEHLIDWAWEVREEYEELMVDLMFHYSPQPRQPLSELEVFTGEILGRGGSLPSHQVRESAFSMRDRFNNGVTYIVQRIIHGNAATEADELDIEPNWADTSSLRDQALERSIACLSVGMKQVKRKDLGRRKLESFRYIAGAVALRECEIFRRRNATSYLGVEILNYGI